MSFCNDVHGIARIDNSADEVCTRPISVRHHIPDAEYALRYHVAL